jgi:hypothetical protein
MDAKQLNELALEHTAKALQDNGISAKAAQGTAGVNITAYLASIPGKSLALYAKASNPDDTARPRRFRIAMPMGELMQARNTGQEFEEVWTERIYAADYHIFFAVRLKEFWVFPAHKTFELFHGDAPAEENIMNVLEAASPMKQQAKEINLDEEKDGVPLEQKLDFYRNNFEIILNELEED